MEKETNHKRAPDRRGRRNFGFQYGRGNKIFHFCIHCVVPALENKCSSRLRFSSLALKIPFQLIFQPREWLQDHEYY